MHACWLVEFSRQRKKNYSIFFNDKTNHDRHNHHCHCHHPTRRLFLLASSTPPTRLTLLKTRGGKRGDATCSISCSLSEFMWWSDLLISHFKRFAQANILPCHVKLPLSLILLCRVLTKEASKLYSSSAPYCLLTIIIIIFFILCFFLFFSRSSTLFLLPPKLIVIVTLSQLSSFLCYAYLLPRPNNQFGSVFPQHHTISHTHAHQLHTGFFVYCV